MLNLFAIRRGSDSNISVHRKIDREIQDHNDLFQNWQEILESFEKRYCSSESFNIHYTVAHHNPPDQRKEKSWQYQDIIPIDIDDKQNPPREEDIPAYIALISQLINVPKEDFITVWSGRGLHILIQVPPMDKETFNSLRMAYSKFTDLLVEQLKEAGLPGKCDAIWDMARTLRMPGTLNVKPVCNVPTEQSDIKNCRIVYGDLKLSSFNLSDYAPIPAKLTQPPKNFPPIQDEYVVEQCAFLRAELANGGATSLEPRWVAALGLVSFFSDKDTYVHDVSKGHPEYTYEATEQKSMERLDSGPRGCASINYVECEGCEHRFKGGSPVHFKRPPQVLQVKGKGKDIANLTHPEAVEIAKDSLDGFSIVKEDKNGNKKVTRLHNQLREYFEQVHPYIQLGDVERTMIFKENHYQKINEQWIKQFANQHFRPYIEQNKDRTEFFANITTHNVTDMSFFDELPEGLINLKNGIYNVKTSELLPHSPKYAFQYILPYNYDPLAKCPTFDALLNNMFGENEDAKQTLKEYLGYCVLGGKYEHQKALILYGPGGNGKSTITKLFRALLGGKNCSAIRLKNMGKQFVAAGLEGKLANISEDEKENCFRYEDDFKSLTGDSPIRTGHKFEGEFDLVNKAKMIITFNNLPDLNDLSEGMRRRLLVMHCNMDMKANPEKKIPNIDAKLLAELPGILNSALQALANLQERGDFMELEESAALIQEMKTRSNEIVEWCEDQVLVTGNVLDKVTSNELYDAFRRDTGSMAYACHSFMRKFNDWAESRGVGASRRIREKDNVVRGVCGIRLPLRR